MAEKRNSSASAAEKKELVITRTFNAQARVEGMDRTGTVDEMVGTERNADQCS
jgi:hypothetical protein